MAGAEGARDRAFGLERSKRSISVSRPVDSRRGRRPKKRDNRHRCGKKPMGPVKLAKPANFAMGHGVLDIQVPLPHQRTTGSWRVVSAPTCLQNPWPPSTKCHTK